MRDLKLKESKHFLALLTSKDRRETLASILLGVPITPAPSTERERMIWQWMRGNPWPAFDYFVEQGKPVPAWVARGVQRERHERQTPKKRGRHAHPEQEARQRADDWACFMGMEWLVRIEQFKPTPAGEYIGTLMNLSRQAVIDAWKREKPRSSEK